MDITDVAEFNSLSFFGHGIKVDMQELNVAKYSLGYDYETHKLVPHSKSRNQLIIF